MTFPEQVKANLLDIISEMATHKDDFSKHPGTDFSRSSTMPCLFHSFNSCYPYPLYRGKYQLLAADGSSFTFTRNPLDPDSYFAPDGKTTNGYNQIHVVPLYDLLSK